MTKERKRHESTHSQTPRIQITELMQIMKGLAAEGKSILFISHKLQEIMEAYKKEGKSVYTPTFIEDNEDKVKALQKQYEFTYTIEER